MCQLELILILIGVLLMYELKSSIDAIAFSQIKDKPTRRKFHIFAWLYIVIVALLISYEYSHGLNMQFVAMLFYMSFLRASYFAIRLNNKRNKDWNHLGTEGYDKAIQWLFRGKTTPYFIIVTLITAASACYAWYLTP